MVPCLPNKDICYHWCNVSGFPSEQAYQLTVFIQSSHALNELYKQLICNPTAFYMKYIQSSLATSVKLAQTSSFSGELLEINSHLCCTKIKGNKP